MTMRSTCGKQQTAHNVSQGSEEALKAGAVHLGALEIAVGSDGGLAGLVVQNGHFT